MYCFLYFFFLVGIAYSCRYQRGERGRYAKQKWHEQKKIHEKATRRKSAESQRYSEISVHDVFACHTMCIATVYGERVTRVNVVTHF